MGRKGDFSSKTSEKVKSGPGRKTKKQKPPSFPGEKQLKEQERDPEKKPGSRQKARAKKRAEKKAGRIGMRSPDTKLTGHGPATTSHVSHTITLSAEAPLGGRG